jgi:hypothetical protein
MEMRVMTFARILVRSELEEELTEMRVGEHVREGAGNSGVNWIIWKYAA